MPKITINKTKQIKLIDNTFDKIINDLQERRKYLKQEISEKLKNRSIPRILDESQKLAKYQSFLVQVKDVYSYMLCLLLC